MSMNYANALSGNFNEYRSGWMKSRNSASLSSDTFTKNLDFTFSLGRPTTRREVGNLLCRCGIFDSYQEISKNFTHISINNNNMENGQVLITCRKDGIADEIVDKLNGMEDSPVKRCHSYNNREVAVKFHFIHPSVNIQRDIVDKFLCKFGKVKSWHPQIDPLFKLLTGQYIFIMFEEDLKKNPLPQTIFINGVPTAVHYSSRVKTYFKCREGGHYKSDCSEKDAGEQRGWICGEEGHFKRDCPKNTLLRSGISHGSHESLPGLEEDPKLPSAGETINPFLNGVRPEDEVKSNKKDQSATESATNGLENGSNNNDVEKTLSEVTEKTSDPAVKETVAGGAENTMELEEIVENALPVNLSSESEDDDYEDMEVDEKKKLARKRNESLAEKAKRRSKWNTKRNSKVKIIPVKKGTIITKVDVLPSDHHPLNWADGSSAGLSESDRSVHLPLDFGKLNCKSNNANTDTAGPS